MKRKWYDYMWIVTVVYLLLGFFNIMAAWLGLLCFTIPLLISLLGGGKAYCNKYCGRGQLFGIIGGNLGISRKRDIPSWMKSRNFRYAFLVFFMSMFAVMLWNTWMVFQGAENMKEVVTILWTFKVPWHHATVTGVEPWVSQFAYGFYSLMLTSTILGIATMILYKPRSWCIYCPMGTMTQEICRIKNKI